ncbi:MAG: hypothetical protein J5888_05110 [Bacteroidaceae bacterium]|nr:hypothetical protein [Bacteroidaceae bacterium]
MKETTAKSWIADGKIKTPPALLYGRERWARRSLRFLMMESRKIIFQIFLILFIVSLARLARQESSTKCDVVKKLFLRLVRFVVEKKKMVYE